MTICLGKVAIKATKHWWRGVVIGESLLLASTREEYLLHVSGSFIWSHFIDKRNHIAYFRVHSLAISLYFSRSVLYIRAISGTKGSSGLGSVSSEQMDRRTETNKKWNKIQMSQRKSDMYNIYIDIYCKKITVLVVSYMQATFHLQHFNDVGYHSKSLEKPWDINIVL